MWGWRLAAVCVTIAAAVVTVAARVLLPEMVLSADQLQYVGSAARHHRNSRLVKVSLITMVGVTGHFVSYTYIVVIIRDVIGVRGPNQAWLLAAYGIAGVIAVALVARPLDRWPKGTPTPDTGTSVVANALKAANAKGAKTSYAHAKATTARKVQSRNKPSATSFKGTKTGSKYDPLNGAL